MGVNQRGNVVQKSTTESKSRSSLNLWDCAFFLVTVLITAWAIFQTQFQYILGCLNWSEGSPILFLLVLAGCVVWLVPPVWAVLRGIFQRPGWMNAGVYLMCSCLPLAVGFTLHSLSDRGHFQFRNGFHAWINHNVDPVPIRSWLATQPPSNDIISVPSANWPPAIQRLWPERVDLWRGQGVALGWGTGVERRQVFIGCTSDTPAPSEVIMGNREHINSKWNKWGPIEEWRPFGLGSISTWHPAQPGVWWLMTFDQK